MTDIFGLDLIRERRHPPDSAFREHIHTQGEHCKYAASDIQSPLQVRVWMEELKGVGVTEASLRVNRARSPNPKQKQNKKAKQIPHVSLCFFRLLFVLPPAFSISLEAPSSIALSCSSAAIGSLNVGSPTSSLFYLILPD